MLKKRLGDADPRGGAPHEPASHPSAPSSAAHPLLVMGCVWWLGGLEAAAWPSACGGGPPQGCGLHTNGAAGCGPGVPASDSPSAHPRPGQGSCHPPRAMCAQWPQQELGPGVG